MPQFTSPGVTSMVGYKGDNGELGFTYDNKFTDLEASIEFIGGTIAAEGHKPVDEFARVNPKSMSWE